MRGMIRNKPWQAFLYLWASPASLVGLTIALIALGIGARARVVDGTFEVSGGWLSRAVGHTPGARRFHAITFGHVILGVDQDQLEACRAHEQVHVRQYEKWGVLFFPLYLGSSLLELARGRNPYYDNWFEREAREKSACRH